MMPMEARWNKRTGATWKEIFVRAAKEMQLSYLSTATVFQKAVVTRQTLFHLNGNACGIGRCRENPRSAMARSLGISRGAPRSVAHVRLDTDGRVRRALVHKATCRHADRTLSVPMSTSTAAAGCSCKGDWR